MPRDIPPLPSQAEILHPYHVPTTSGQNSRPLIITHNHIGHPRVCLPTIVTFPNRHARRPRVNGDRVEKQPWNTETCKWEEPTLAGKERLPDYRLGDTMGGAGSKTSTRCTPGSGHGRERFAMAGSVPTRIPRPSMR